MRSRPAATVPPTLGGTGWDRLRAATLPTTAPSGIMGAWSDWPALVNLIRYVPRAGVRSGANPVAPPAFAAEEVLDMTLEEIERIYELPSRPESGFRQLRQFVANLRGDAPLVCAECGAEDDGATGWTLRRADDDELVAFCPHCDTREFHDA